MATTKKAANTATDKNAKPVKSPVLSKPQLVAGTATQEPKPAVKKAPVDKKAATKASPKVAATSSAAAKPKATKAAKSVTKAVIEPSQRANYIEVAAFYIAERRGFAPGNPEQDYLEAAAEIDHLIAAGHFGK